ncbi:hypothetical protein RFI_00429 [Reticulomyxa filosa]|uniref:Uncharacterized protein n=1 Tax=Reticulomyxa filosa TaxID=46433 RepID=X6PEV0_RETFI|nr:hypothetical protein RFI_00429 [Reticulomyxa filosa]|eukprot:ETO36633.1 hypothetical protein RFI_00429 [Reticulomyxa filosa]
MSALNIQEPFLKTERFACDYASEEPEAYTNMEQDNASNMRRIDEHEQEDEYAQDDRSQHLTGGNIKGQQFVNESYQIDDSAFDDPNLPVKCFTQHYYYAKTMQNYVKQTIQTYLMALQLEKKFETFRKLLEQFMEDCDGMYNQLLQECDNQMQQNY